MFKLFDLLNSRPYRGGSIECHNLGQVLLVVELHYLWLREGTQADDRVRATLRQSFQEHCGRVLHALQASRALFASKVKDEDKMEVVRATATAIIPLLVWLFGPFDVEKVLLVVERRHYRSSHSILVALAGSEFQDRLIHVLCPVVKLNQAIWLEQLNLDILLSVVLLDDF